MSTQQPKQQNASSSSQGQSGWIPITAAANLDMGATSGSNTGAIVNMNGVQGVGSFGDPIDALFGGMAGLFGSGVSVADESPIPGFNVGPILSIAVLGLIGVVLYRAVRRS